MVIADVAFNVLMLAIDSLAFLRARRSQNRGLLRRFMTGAVVFSAAVACVLAAVLWHSGSAFAAMRFAGMAGLWHFPSLLLGFAWQSRHSRLRYLFVGAASLVLLVYVYAYHIEPFSLEITHCTYSHRLLQGLSRPVVIAHVSDIQCESLGVYEKKIFAELARIKPDMIVYTGDYVQVRDIDEYAGLARGLVQAIRDAGLNPPLGSYAVLGNTDPPELWREVFADGPVRLLEDETIAVDLPGAKISLTGLSYAVSRGPAPRSAAYLDPAGAGALERSEGAEEVRANRLDIVAGHSPDFVERLAQTRMPFLALAGHTHGGQVRLPFYGPIITFSRLPRKYADCFVPYGSGTLSVTRGVGLERLDAPRLRFLCRPEIRLITLAPPPSAPAGQD